MKLCKKEKCKYYYTECSIADIKYYMYFEQFDKQLYELFEKNSISKNIKIPVCSRCSPKHNGGLYWLLNNEWVSSKQILNDHKLLRYIK